MKIRIEQGESKNSRVVLKGNIGHTGRNVNILHDGKFVGAFGLYTDPRNNSLVIYFPTLEVEGYANDWKDE